MPCSPAGAPTPSDVRLVVVVVGNPAVILARSTPGEVPTGLVGETVEERRLDPVRAKQVPAQPVDEQHAPDPNVGSPSTLRSPRNAHRGEHARQHVGERRRAVSRDDQVGREAGGRTAHGASRAVAVETAAPNRWVRVTRSLPSAAALTRSTKSSAVTVPV